MLPLVRVYNANWIWIARIWTGMTNLSRTLLNNQNTNHQLRMVHVRSSPSLAWSHNSFLVQFFVLFRLFFFLLILETNMLNLWYAASVYPGRSTRMVSDAAEKLSNMSLSSGRQAMKQSVPPPMKAGGWHGQSHVFAGRSQDIQPSRTITRKVAGWKVLYILVVLQYTTRTVAVGCYILVVFSWCVCYLLNVCLKGAMLWDLSPRFLCINWSYENL